MKHPLIQRKEAAQAVIHKYLDQPFVWGSHDCVHLVADALIGLGHPDPLDGLPAYDSLLGAKKAMRAVGVSTFEERIDSLGFERIAPASALPCDIWSIPTYDGNDDWRTLGVFVQHDRVLVFSEAGCIWLVPSTIPTVYAPDVIAWRVV